MKIPSIPIRHTLYVAATVVGVVIPLAVTLHLIDPVTGLAILKFAALFGGGAAGTAAVVLGQQKKDGTLAFQGSPTEQAIAAIEAVAQEVATASLNAAKVKAAATAANASVQHAQEVPVLGPLAQQALNSLAV